MANAPPKLKRIGAADRKAWRAPNAKPKTTTERGYGWQHQKARRALLEAEPLCRECKKGGRVTIATIADHVHSMALNGRRATQELQPICGPCSAAKTLSEAREGSKRAREGGGR